MNFYTLYFFRTKFNSTIQNYQGLVVVFSYRVRLNPFEKNPDPAKKGLIKIHLSSSLTVWMRMSIGESFSGTSMPIFFHQPSHSPANPADRWGQGQHFCCCGVGALFWLELEPFRLKLHWLKNKNKFI